MKRYLQVQVVYRQGLVKSYLAEENILLKDFEHVVKAMGKIKTVRWLPDVDQATADLLVRTGAATMIEVRRVEA